MKKLALFLPIAIIIACVSAAHSQSLAELAKKEKERRAQIKENRVISDTEAEKFRTAKPESSAPESSAPEMPSGEVEAAKTESAKGEGAAAKAAESQKTDPNEPTDYEGRTESYWRKTMVDARQKIKNLTNEANVIQLSIADLQNKFYSMDDGFKRETIQRELQKTYYQQDLNKENLKKAEAELQELEMAARKSGALPGWIH